MKIPPEILEAESLTAASKTPWTLERCNGKGVTVKDSEGNIVLNEEFNDFPSEWSHARVEQIGRTFRAQARFMVLMSQAIQTFRSDFESKCHEGMAAKFDGALPFQAIGRFADSQHCGAMLNSPQCP
jgi:hypothetical protein